MPKKPPLGLVLADNLRQLMAHHGLSQNELGRLADVGQSTLSRLLDSADPSTSNPRASTLEALADFFKVDAWKLLVPNAPIELLVEKTAQPGLLMVVDTYLRASDVGRQTILRVSETEARFAVEKPVLFSRSARREA